MKEIRFSRHALEKLTIIQRQGFAVDEASIVTGLQIPRVIAQGYLDRFIVRLDLDEDHILRVVYEEGVEITIVTLYPGRRTRYED